MRDSSSGPISEMVARTGWPIFAERVPQRDGVAVVLEALELEFLHPLGDLGIAADRAA